MGLLYSIMFYLSPPIKLSPAKIQLSALRMQKSIQLRLQKLQTQNQKLQKQFIKMVKGKSPQMEKRNPIIQKLKINDMIYGAIKFGVYEELLKCCRKIKQESTYIAEDQSKISEECLKGVFAIVHLYRDFELFQIVDLKQFLPQPYPVITPSQLPPSIRQFLEYSQPSQYQRNIYLLQMIAQHPHQVTLQEINCQSCFESYHNFTSNPQKSKSPETFSADLYARSIQFEITEQVDMEMEDFAA